MKKIKQLLELCIVKEGDVVDTLILRMVPFVERNYNMIEIGPRATGKTYFYQQISPHSHLVAGGKASVAKMIYKCGLLAFVRVLFSLISPRT
jgi:predicted ATP-dependent Lon-type protease